MGWETVNSSCPDVSLHVAVTLPPFFPLIHLVKENRRNHLICNCLLLLLLGSITQTVGIFLISFCLLQKDVKKEVEEEKFSQHLLSQSIVISLPLSEWFWMKWVHSHKQHHHLTNTLLKQKRWWNHDDSSHCLPGWAPICHPPFIFLLICNQCFLYKDKW